MGERAEPSSLAEALALVARERPARDAGPRGWITFHHANASLFAGVMKSDPQFKFEASEYSFTSMRIAREIERVSGLIYCRSTWS